MLSPFIVFKFAVEEMSNRCCFILRIAFIRFYKWTLHVHHMYVTDKSPRLFTLNREYVPEKSWSESCTKPNGPSTWVHVYSLAFLSYCQHFSWRYFWLQHFAFGLSLSWWTICEKAPLGRLAHRRDHCDRCDRRYHHRDSLSSEKESEVSSIPHELTNIC